MPAWYLKPLLGVARWIWLLGVLVLIVAAIWWAALSVMGGKTAKVKGRLATNQAEAAIESGQDAVETVGRTIEYERHVDYITRETERVIREAPGADAPVDPALHRLGLDRLCERAAYSEHAACVQPSPAE